MTMNRALAHRRRTACTAQARTASRPPQHTTGLTKAAKRVVYPGTELSI
ncbi:Uncharacterised protein [Flavonifractor plautii]|uniref:Uncharacterized protein n=1 Tax=Flavonifractor plautii TaxID=292800 RepID=A0A174F5W4_FLAPL|nr:Uncharacterised protein [Flavonifractor plautii]